MGIRAPDAIVPIYPALALMPDMPSPSRALSVMDPLISFGALVACLRVCGRGLCLDRSFIDLDFNVSMTVDKY